MTIEELRSAMRRKVVPEEVVPQNIINNLIDEDAEPPKPDAFTFLMRLRALGIGSTDFVNLLEGCGAPEGVVARIRHNPAMNLQGLILTLENSELDSDDYTRMLLTARQVWERTLTLRLEKSETLSHIIDDYEEESEEDHQEPEPEEEYEEEFDPEYDEDMREMSFTAVFEKINAEIKAGKITPSEASEASEPLDEAEEDEKIPEPTRSAKPEPPVEDEDDDYDASADLSFMAAFDKIKAEKKLAFSEKAEEQSLVLDKTSEQTPENSDIQPPMLDKAEERHARGALRAEPEPVEEEPVEEIEEPKPIEKPKGRSIDELLKTARQLRRDRIVEDVREEEDEEEPREFDEEYDEDYDEEYDGEYDEDEDYDDYEDYEDEPRRRSGFNKSAIIWAASGAAILVCAGVLVGVTLGKKNGGASKSLGYAEDGAEVFQKIAEAYNAETPGGESPSELSPDYSTLFGDLLINGENGSSLGSFAIGAELYSVSETAISANIVENGTIRALADVTPPEKARFVAAFDDGGKLYALFSGKQSGYVKVSGGKAEYTVKQDGVLTDYDYADGEMRLGTVYTPVFTETFRIEDEDTYLPKSGAAGLTTIPASSVIMTETPGYSYGVSAGYAIENGERKDACAVIGNPVAASADGRFALNNKTDDSENGLLITTGGKNPEARTTEKLLRAAFYKDGGVILEEKISIGSADNPESGANTVTLLNSELKPASILSGVPETITGMWFDGGLLTINGSGNSILRVDCTDPTKPEPLTLKAALGVTAASSALTLETNGEALVITRYDLENGKAIKVCEYVKELPPEHLMTVALGDPKTAVISGTTSGIAYQYHDEVSMVSEYVVFASGLQPNVETLFDDTTGFTAAFSNDGRISAVCGEGVKHLT